MSPNAFVLDWTMTDFAGLKAKLAAAKFAFVQRPDDESIRVDVPLPRLDEFAVLCQGHLNAPFNYVDIQYPAEKKR